MMSEEERRMLECAARVYVPSSWRESKAYMEGFMRSWNPIKDDGDALRLAAHLKMLVDFDSGIADVEGFDPVSDSDIKRAITLAAARLGGYEE